MNLHPHVEARKAMHAPTTADVVALAKESGGKLTRFNAWLAVKITSGVGTMWCAYGFSLLALISLPDAIKGGRAAIISWIAQTFIQLVLLSIIIVGQNIASTASDLRSEATYKDAEAVLHTSLELEAHLERQDAILAELTERLERLTGRMEAANPALAAPATTVQTPTKAPAKAPVKRAPTKRTAAKAAPAAPKP